MTSGRKASPRATCAIFLALTLALGCVTPSGEPTRSSPETSPETALSGIRQLTFQGRRSGEGYFSRDGSKLVFQSEREPGNPFYQIYLMDLETGDTRRVSPGIGKTTCAWIHPGGSRVLFSSTHADPQSKVLQERELQARAEGVERRYAWDYDEHFDIYIGESGGSGEAEGGAARVFLPALGYDAEASWSPDGRQIVFASNRHAYAEAMSATDREKLSADPSSFIDLYLADVRGGEPTRLTRSRGYDGGPFFSADGQRIVWRRFSEDGASAEVFTMKTDGSDVRQLTKLGAMSWAPYFHPSGEYIIFTSSLEGFSNFELYIVDAQGEREPVRVTRSPGFDGLPAFSTDGRKLAWTSRRGGGGRSQIHLAKWSDSEARRMLALPPARTEGVAPLLPLPEHTRAEIDTSDLQTHVRALASEVTAGRRTGTAGERIATGYVARMFRRIGLEPEGENGSYFQSFGFTAGVSLGEDNRLRILQSASELRVDRDWRPLAFSKVGQIEASEVAFAGYGIVAPAEGELAAVDDYDGLDVTDRWVLLLRYAPERLDSKARRRMRHFSSLRYKAMLARERGARGIIVASGPNSKVQDELADLVFDASLAGSGIAAISIRDEVAEQLLASSGQNLRDLQDKLDSGAATAGFVLPGVRLEARIELRQQRRKGRNVLGRLVLGNEAKPGTVVLGAHVDHLGQGKAPGSLARNIGPDAIHFGADDNASGVSAVIEIAEALTAARDRGELDGGRDLIFAAWSGEEVGLLGSTHYVESIASEDDSPHAVISGKVTAYINMDMVGRLHGPLVLYGTGSSSVWLAEIERENAAVALSIHTQDESYLPTDATPFFLKGVPILSAFTGAHEDYHTPNDVYEKLNYEGMRKIARLISRMARSLSLRPEVPDYIPIARGENVAPRAGLRVYIGSIPDYAHTDVIGVRLAGVAPGGPAEAGGLRAGDVVVTVGDRRIENIYDYTFALGDLSIGEAVQFEVERQGQRVSLTVVPASRD